MRLAGGGPSWVAGAPGRLSVWVNRRAVEVHSAHVGSLKLNETEVFGERRFVFIVIETLHLESFRQAGNEGFVNLAVALDLLLRQLRMRSIGQKQVGGGPLEGLQLIDFVLAGKREIL